jgi:hypothetical protein
LLLAGGKKDYTAKIWDPACWRDVVMQMRQDGHRVVQVGGVNDKHPSIHGTHNVVGHTGIRDLINLIYHSEGVLCGVTAVMHMAAALQRPCVVVAGGREGWWWEAYTKENRDIQMAIADSLWKVPSPDNYVPHRYLHTIGQLDCCHRHGCWKSKIEQNATSHCKRPVTPRGIMIPKCLDMITPDMVVEAVRSYYEEGYLDKRRGDITYSLPAPEPIAPPQPIKLTDTELTVCCHTTREAHVRGLTNPDHQVVTYSPSQDWIDVLLDMSQRKPEGWVVWFGDRSYPTTRRWPSELLHLVAEGGADAYGRIHWVDFDGDRVEYPHPQFFAIRAETLQKMNMESIIGRNGSSEVVWGKELRRVGGRLARFEGGVAIECP